LLIIQSAFSSIVYFILVGHTTKHIIILWSIGSNNSDVLTSRIVSTFRLRRIHIIIIRHRISSVCDIALRIIMLRSVVLICRKIWGSGSVRWSHHFVSDYTLRQYFSNTQQSRFLTDCRKTMGRGSGSVKWSR